MSCATRNGQGQPFFGGYHLGEGYECVSCVENDLTKPFWNGSECVSCATADITKPVWNVNKCEACPTDTAWDSSKEQCVKQEDLYELILIANLADIYIVDGAPNQSYNGIYEKTNNTIHGVPVYSNGTNYLAYNTTQLDDSTYSGSYWYLSTSIDVNITPAYNMSLSGGGSAAADFASPEGAFSDLTGGNGPTVRRYPTCAYNIPHDGKTLCLVEAASSRVFVQKPADEKYSITDYGFGYISENDVNTAFLEKYGIQTTITEDYWAGAMKYCQDKGLRLPTISEIAAILQVVYNLDTPCLSSCDNLSIVNLELANFICLGSGAEGCYLWSNQENVSNQTAWRVVFNAYDIYTEAFDRYYTTPIALCVK